MSEPQSGALAGKIIYRDDPAYEAARQSAVWNARKPPRFPEAIVMAECDADVVAAVRLARARGWQVGVRSGGHSWVGAHTRDNSILINLSRMQQIEVDAAARVAVVSPAVQGQALNQRLREDHGLMFPSGHCYGVPLGGFVMAGGHGWNARNWGPACASLRAIDVVTADGDLIHASETENSDYLWAARGAGPGFFGAAVRYYLDLYPRPKVMKASRYVLPIDVVEQVTAWVADNAVSFPRAMEVVFIGMAPEGAPEVRLIANTMADSEAEVDAALDLLHACPGIEHAIRSQIKQPIVLPLEERPPLDINPEGARFAVDNIWTNATGAQIAPFMREHFSNYPTPESYVFWQCWGPVHALKDMAYSVQANIYLSSNAVYRDAADDRRCEAWAIERMRKLQSISAGAQMNDENTAGRKERYLSDDAARRLEAMRAKYDPERRFVGFLNVNPYL